MHHASAPTWALSLAFAASTLLPACASSGAPASGAPAAPTAKAQGTRMSATTITLPPEGAIPAGAPTIAVPEAAAGRAASGGRGAVGSATDDLLATPAGSSAETMVRTVLYPRARTCYAAQLKRERTARGRIVVALQVRGDGNVAASTAQIATGLAPDTVACIEASAKKLVFVPPGGRGAHVTVPMSFAPEDAGDALAAGDAESAVQRDIAPIVLECYAAAREAGGKGGIDFVVKIGEGGAPMDVSGARDPSVGAVVAECATEKLRALRFEAAAGREIVVPIELRHAEDTQGSGSR